MSEYKNSIVTPKELLEIRKRIKEEEDAKQAAREKAIADEINKEVPFYLNKFSSFLRKTGELDFHKAAERNYFRSYVAEEIAINLIEAGWVAKAVKVIKDKEGNAGYCWTVEVSLPT